VRQTLDHLVDRAIAAQHDDQIGASGDGFPSEISGVTRSGGGEYAGSQASSRQRRSGTLKETLGIPPDLASGSVVN
jgi:hypothetical protein